MNKWDSRFMSMAALVGSWSKDPDHKVGAVIANAQNHPVGMGFNGPPKHVFDMGLARKVEVVRTIHAELNAILNSNTSLEGCTLYVYPFSPCAQCAAAIIQKGIARVVYAKESDLETWKASQEEALQMFIEAGVFTEGIFNNNIKNI